jgi:hypothetical protein
MESEDGMAVDVCHSDNATNASTNANQKPTQHGGIYYRFGHELPLLRRLFSIINCYCLFFFTEMVSEDGISDDLCHTDQATDASTVANQKPKQHGRVNNDMKKVFASVRKVATGVGMVAAKGVGVSDASSVSGAVDDDRENKKEKRLGKRIVKAGVSVSAGWAGNVGGQIVGASIGGAVGALFGGVGAIPGVAIGTVIGSAVGSYGSKMARRAAEGIVDKLTDETEKEKEKDQKNAICSQPS